MSGVIAPVGADSSQVDEVVHTFLTETVPAHTCFASGRVDPLDTRPSASLAVVPPIIRPGDIIRNVRRVDVTTP